MATVPPALPDNLVESLPDDLVEYFLRRLPREDPASLVRASLVCKRWRRVLADRGFCRRFCEHLHLHQMPAMLGFFGRGYGPTTEANSLVFTPTSSFRPRSPAARGLTGDQFAVDARHGRVLLARKGFLEEPSACCFSVWDPITGGLLELPRLPQRQTAHFTWKAVVLCASIPSTSTTSSCDHHDCHRGPFLVVFVGTSAQEVYAYVYSSQAGAWSHTATAAREATDQSSLFYQNELCRSAVTGNAAYFRLLNNIRVLKYDLRMQEISSVDLPEVPYRWAEWSQILLTTTQYGGWLGVARVDMPRIRMWLGKPGPDGLFRWLLARDFELSTVHHGDLPPLFVVDIADNLSAIIISSQDGVFSIDIEFNRPVTCLCDDNCASYSVPYMSFCIPALTAAFTGEGSGANVSKCKKKKRRKRKKMKLNS